MLNSNENPREERDGGEVLCPVCGEDGGEALDQGGDPDMAQGGAESEEARDVSAPPIPITPTKEEVDKHRLTHRPFRSWCPHCVRGKGRADQYRKSRQRGEYRGIPKLVSDYFFIGRRRPSNRGEREHAEDEAEKEGQTPILVLKDTRSKRIFAHACPCKGAHDLVVDRVVSDLDALGYKRVLVRTDGEAAILDLWNKVKENGQEK